MADRFVAKRNDTRQYLERTLQNADGTVINLSGATVAFNMRKRGGTTLKIDGGAVTVVLASAGTVKYEWATGDLDTVGFYEGEFEVTFGDSTVITVPNEEHIPITVVEDLG